MTRAAQVHDQVNAVSLCPFDRHGQASRPRRNTRRASVSTGPRSVPHWCLRGTSRPAEHRN